MLTIVWDVDDVLNDLMRQWFHSEWLAKNPHCALLYEDLSLNPPHTVLGVDESEYLASLDRFRASASARNMAPNPELLAWFCEHGARCRHIALTARPLATAPDVASWVMRHFSNWIRCFGILPSRPGSEIPIYDQTKGEFLHWLGAGDILIDDTPANRRHAEEMGIKTMAFPQPWSASTISVSELLHQLTAMVNKS